MNPAYSVIFFTSSTGAGYGLVTLLAVLAFAGLIPASRGFGIVAFAVSLSLIGAGLFASTLHLGHPRRAWRALSQWRTSWLSREGVVAVLAFIPVLVYGYGWVVVGTNAGAWKWVGLVAALLAMITVVCTAMIYASLKPIPRWRSAWVPPVYVALGFATGGWILNFVSQLFGVAGSWMVALVAALTVAAWALKLCYWARVDRSGAWERAKNATGLERHGSVRQLESPHTSVNFVMKEMGFTIARRHAIALRATALCSGCVLPLGLLWAASTMPPNGMFALLASGTISSMIGVLVERWLFFAEAQHVVIAYYSTRSPPGGRTP